MLNYILGSKIHQSFLDTHLLRIRDDKDEQASSSVRIMAKSDTSISVMGYAPYAYYATCYYITDTLHIAPLQRRSGCHFFVLVWRARLSVTSLSIVGSNLFFCGVRIPLLDRLVRESIPFIYILSPCII